METKEKASLLAQYQAAKNNLDYFKKEEHELRLKVIDEFFPNAGDGTVTTHHDQLKIKATFRMNYKVDVKALEENEPFFTEAEKACIVRKPSLSVTNYKKLDPDSNVFLDDCLTITPGLPSVSVEVDEDSVFQDWEENHEG